MIFSGGIFVITPLKDHFDGMRTLLNFAGITTFRYQLGLLLAEYVLFAFESVLFIACGFVLS